MSETLGSPSPHPRFMAFLGNCGRHFEQVILINLDRITVIRADVRDPDVTMFYDGSDAPIRVNEPFSSVRDQILGEDE